MCIECIIFYRNINENTYNNTIGMYIVAIQHCGSSVFVYVYARAYIRMQEPRC